MRTVYELSVRQLASRWRLLVIGLLALVPLLPALVAGLSSDKPTPSELDDFLINGILTAAILPIIVLAVAVAAFGNELEDRTLSNLTLTPLPRWHISTAKLAAVLTLCAPILIATGALSVAVAYRAAELEGGASAASATAVGMAVGAAVYGAIFVWAGLVTGRALAVGLLYAFVWEGLFASFVDGVRYFSVRYYTLGIIDAADESLFEDSSQITVSGTSAIVGAAAVFALFTCLTVRRLRTIDVT